MLTRTDPKPVAIVTCVNAAMDSNRPGWNRDGRGDSRKMDTDCQYNEFSMAAFLGVVQACNAVGRCPRFKMW